MSKGKRPAISVKTKVGVAIRQSAYGALTCPLCFHWLMPLEDRILEHMVPRETKIALGQDPDDPENLRWVHKACALKKTNGTKATCADGDIHKIAKAKRIARGGKKSKHPFPKVPDAIKQVRRQNAKAFRAKVKMERQQQSIGE